jgi:ABC-type uncharacterized transport system substrate-binding protein
MRRRDFIAGIAGSTAALSLAANAQQAGKIARLGFLGATFASLAAEHSLPFTGSSEFAEAGALIGYGADFLDMCRRSAVFVDKILKGARPADIPVEQATKFETVLNLTVAKSLGVKIPTSILLRADRVIE